MKKKILIISANYYQNISNNLQKGIEKVHLICGTKKNCLLKELNTEEGVGTAFEKNYVEY